MTRHLLQHLAVKDELQLDKFDAFVNNEITHFRRLFMDLKNLFTQAEV
jgi:isopenicillin N synthase-like dioxygenase